MARFRPSPAMLVAFVALLAALGGTGFAATQHTDKAQDSALIKALAPPPKVYVNHRASKQLPGGIANDMLVVTLPRGKYLASANLNVGRTSASGEANAFCSLTAQTGTTGASDFDFIAADNIGADGGEDRAVISLQLPVRIGPGGGSVHLRCFQFQIGLNPVQLTATSIRLAAVAVR